jgi:hypothetical protein
MTTSTSRFSYAIAARRGSGDPRGREKRCEELDPQRCCTAITRSVEASEITSRLVSGRPGDPSAPVRVEPRRSPLGGNRSFVARKASSEFPRISRSSQQHPLSKRRCASPSVATSPSSGMPRGGFVRLPYRILGYPWTRKFTGALSSPVAGARWAGNRAGGGIGKHDWPAGWLRLKRCWGDMDAETRGLWEKVGWDKDTWDKGRQDELPVAWETLSEDSRAAAASLGYDARFVGPLLPVPPASAEDWLFR